MTTATRTQKPATGADALPGISFEERLSLAVLGLDAKLDHFHGDGLAEARKVAAAAVAAAATIYRTAPDLNGRNLDPETFEPNPILKAAGDLIRTRGWHRGEWESPVGGMCALRAMQAATTQGGHQASDLWDAQNVLLDRIAADTGKRLAVPAWNDGRTDVQQVLRLMY